jgi:SGNH hydrolase-like domain, acetyltransferase AlgX
MVSKPPKLLFVALSIVFGLLTGGVITEVALRVGGYSPMYVNPLNAFHEGDPIVGYRGRPNFAGKFRRPEFDVVVAHNEKGFRKHEYQQPQNSNDRKIMVFGDSFVWGWGVGQGMVFTDRMSQLMKGYQVMNFGLAASSTVQQFALFEAYGKQQIRSGDTVVLTFFGNDFTDNLAPGFLHAEIRNGEVRRVGPDRLLASGKTSNPLRKSYAFNLTAFSVNAMKATLKRRRALDRASTLIQVGAESPEVAIARYFLAEFHRAVAEKGASFIAVYVPMQGELGEASEVSEKALSETSLKNEQAYRRAFFACAEALGIVTIDLLPHFLAAKRSGRYERFTYVRDLHWNDSGHELAAQVIADFILSGKREHRKPQPTVQSDNGQDLIATSEP